jgi:uncharacterized protein YgiM (DUF1202 family)
MVHRKLALFIVALFSTITSLGQVAEVTRNVNLRNDPSTANAPIRLVLVGEQLTLLEPEKTADYYHVTTAQSEEGWVWSHNVHVLATTPTPTPAPGVTATPTPVPALTSTATPIPSGPAPAIDQSWDKPTPQGISYTTTHGTCPPGGKSGSDTPTNLRKNRVDTPTAYHEVTFDAISTLTYPHDTTKRINWQAQNLADIARFEGVALSVVGYLSSDVKVETSEACNCSYSSPDKITEVDWHMYLTSQPSRPIAEAVVVETTPRVRKNRTWDRATLLGWVNSTNQVRISGWLMLDPEHASMVGSARETIWEVHPITKIEVWKNGGWVDLETLP